MELDNLKAAWQGQVTNAGAHSKEQILSMLQKKSQRPIARMKRNLLVELILIVVIYTVTIIYYAITRGGRYWQIALMLFAVGFLFLLYYYQKNKLLKSMECVACEVRSNLQRQVTMLEKYVRLYFIAGVILTPLAYFTAGIIAIYKAPPQVFSASTHYWFFGSGIIIAIVSYFLNKWYVNKLYGQHVKKLKALLLQMEEAE